MNTKIESSTNQSLISKLKFLLWDAKSWTSQLIELAPIVCLNPLRDVNPRNQNWIPYTQYIKKLAQRWVFTRLWINSKILFDEAAQLLSIIIHELAFWMVSNHGCTCPFAIILMNITVAERNSTIVSKWMYQRIVKSLKSIYGFSTLLGPLPIRRCRLHSNRDPGIEMSIVLSQSNRDFYFQKENIIASIQNLELIYSIPPNLDILKKLDFSEWNQSLTIQNKKTPCAFQSAAKLSVPRAMQRPHHDRVFKK
jgi:hypothetical protein